MKKAINIALLAIILLSSGFFCLEVFAENVSLPPFEGSASFTSIQKVGEFARVSEAIQEKSTSQIKLYKDSETASKALAIVDEGKLPLFSGNTATSSSQMPATVDTLATGLSLITSLVGIVVLALALSWFLQKKSGIAYGNFGKVLGIVPLDNKRLIYIVDVMGKMLVLGVTESNINCLAEITDKDTLDAYRLKYGQSVTPGLDKLFPFLRKSEKEAVLSDSVKEEKEKREALQSVRDVRDKLEKSRENRVERLKNMLISKTNSQGHKQ